jgi:single-strand DNA-binding protein
MLNQTVIVGRISKEPEIKELEDGKKVCNLSVAVPRSYKNAEGVYDTDFVDCTLWNSVAENTLEYCHSGDLIGVKGRIETSFYEKDGEKRKSTNIVAEKITFLSSKAKVKEQDDEMEF